MKRFSLPAALAAALLLSPMAMSQNTKQPYCRIQPAPGKAPAGEPNLFDGLNLTPAQQAQVQQLGSKKTHAYDKRVDSERKKYKKERQDYLKKMKKLLNPTQYAEFERRFNARYGGGLDYAPAPYPTPATSAPAPGSGSNSVARPGTSAPAPGYVSPAKPAPHPQRMTGK